MVSYTPGALQGLNFALDLWKQQQSGQEQQQLQQYRALQMRETLAEMARKQRADALQQQYATWLGSQAGGLLQGGSQVGALQGLRPLPPELQGTAPPQATSGYSLPQVPNATGQMAAPIGLRNQVLGLEGNQDYAVGRAGEIGPGQIMPATGAQYGFSPSQLYGDSGRYASGQIVNDLYRRSGGDAAATLVGYNRGPGAMSRFQASGDNPASVSLAPDYQKAVLADLSPEQQQHGSQAALAAAAAAPPQMIGQAGPGVFAQLIERLAGSNMSDEAKGYAMMQLLPLMSKEGQQQFTQALDIAKLQQQGTEFGIRQQEIQANREQTAELARERMGIQSNKGWQIVQTPDGRTLRVNPNTGEMAPVDLPAGTGKLGASQGPPPDPGRVAFWANVMEKGMPMPAGLARTAAGSNFVRAVMNKLADDGIASSQNASGDYIANVATTKADQSSLTNLTKQADAATSFERTANANLDNALRLSKDAVPTDLGPWVNRWIETGETQFGGPDVPPYVAAVLTAANEYAKIMNGSTGSQGSTVDSRREAAEMLSPYLNQGQIQGVAQVLKQDMANRRNSMYGQIEDIKRSLRTGQQRFPTGTEGQGQPTATQGQASGDITFKGKRYAEEPAGAIDVPDNLKDVPDGKIVGDDEARYVKRGSRLILLLPVGK